MQTQYDANDWPLAPGARVYVPPRRLPGYDSEVSGFRGVVSEVREGEIDIIEFGTLATRTVRPGDVKVQRGNTNESKEYYLIIEKLRRRR